MNTKAIYMPKGKAGEYAKYACNFYVGCSNDCEYCYCKKGVLGHALGGPKAVLKKCFRDEKDALRIFRLELKKYLEELRKYGLFFTFTSDPFLQETKQLTIDAVYCAASYGIPCKILTKRADFIDDIPGEWIINKWYRNKIAFGFTLTGHDELEPGASTNTERIQAMKTLHSYGFKTFASVEPIIDLHSAARMIGQTNNYCDLYLIGLMTGQKDYTPNEVKMFVIALIGIIGLSKIISIYTDIPDMHIYLKDSVIKYACLDPLKFRTKPFVDENYNLFHPQSVS